MTEQQGKSEPRHLQRGKCDYICVNYEDHDGQHFEGYELPSPRRYDRVRFKRFGKLHIGWGDLP